MTKKIFLLTIFPVVLTANLFAAPGSLSLSLSQSEAAALDTSPKYQSVLAEARSAGYISDSQMAQLFPKIYLEGYYRHVSEVPSFSAIPGGPAFRFGDNKNYSYGPALYWTVFKSGGLYNSWKAEEAFASSKSFEADASKRQLLLESRLAYFEVQLSLVQVKLIVDSLTLVLEQYKDISAKYRAGTLSKIDSLSAHQEVLARERELKRAQADAAEALRNLFALTALGHDVDPTFSLSAETNTKKLPNPDETTLVLTLDPIDSSYKTLLPASKGQPDLAHPAIQALQQSVESANRIATSLKSGHGPTVLFSAKATRDYPNGPVLETINQQTVGVSANWSLFEGGHVKDTVKAQKEQAAAIEHQKEQVSINLIRDWNKAQDELKSLVLQRDITRKSVTETEELARLTYDSYRVGRSSYLEVDNANFTALQVKLTAARIEVQILIQLAILDSLSVKS